MAKMILVIAAHPDDETLGCGGTIARHIAQRDRVEVLILGEGIRSSREASRRALKVLGVKRAYFENLPDNRLDTVPLLDIVKNIERYILKLKPQIIYTHFPGDLNIDHQITYRAVMTAARPIPRCDIEAIYLFEVLSSTDWQLQDKNIFKPNHFVDISKFIKKKITAFKEYKSEIRRFPHQRSIKAVTVLAEYRGSMVGKECCEAFVVERSTI